MAKTSAVAVASEMTLDAVLLSFQFLSFLLQLLDRLLLAELATHQRIPGLVNSLAAYRREG